MAYKILSYLYLSDIKFANCYECLQEHKITHILTIDNIPLYNKNIACNKHSTIAAAQPTTLDCCAVHFVEMLDVVSSNLLEKLHGCFGFMNECFQDEENNLLVHW